jgi:phage-related protein
LAKKQSAVFKKMLTVYFYKESSGSTPVLNWLKELPKSDRLLIGQDLQTLQFRWPLGMPLVRSLDHGMWELRSHLHNRIARIIFVVNNNQIVALHGFIKKTQKTPQQDLKLALTRLKKLETRE